MRSRTGSRNPPSFWEKSWGRSFRSHRSKSEVWIGAADLPLSSRSFWGLVYWHFDPWEGERHGVLRAVPRRLKLMRKGIFSPDSLPLGFIFRRKKVCCWSFWPPKQKKFFFNDRDRAQFFRIRFVGRFRWKLHLHMFLFSSRFLVSLVVRSSSAVLNTVNSILFLLNCLGSMLV